MPADSRSDLIYIEDFTANKQMKFFQALRQNQFSGKLTFRNVQGTKWSFFLAKGKVVYVTGGQHPVRRWRRNLVLHLPQIAGQLSEELQKIDLEAEAKIWLSWDYHLLRIWFREQKTDLDRISANISALMQELFFDLAQAGKLSFRIQEYEKFPFEPLATIDAEQPILVSRKLLSKWQEFNFQAISPNLTPSVVDYDKLKANTSEKTFPIVTRLLDNNRSIRDLALKKQSDSLTFMRSLTSFIEIAAIQFVEIPDLPYPIAIPKSSKVARPRFRPGQTKVACISQNKIMGQQLVKISEKLNCGLLNIVDYIAAVGVLLEEEPDFILIDLELPNASSYDICTQLRKLEYLQNIPIILFGRNIGLVERMKSKMVGASEVFEHSMNIMQVLKLVEKYVA